MEQQREQRIREEVRREIEAEEQRRREAEILRRQEEEDHHEERARQQIVLEEKRKFYENSPEYFEYINENGDSEWLTHKHILAREGFFDYEEHVEDPARGRRLLWVRSLALVALLAALGTAAWIYLSEEVGWIDVVCNIQRAEIHVDGQNSGFLSDARVQVPVGEHMIEVRKAGYDGPGTGVRHVVLGRGEHLLLEFLLDPAP